MLFVIWADFNFTESYEVWSGDKVFNHLPSECSPVRIALRDLKSLIFLEFFLAVKMLVFLESGSVFEIKGVLVNIRIDSVHQDLVDVINVAFERKLFIILRLVDAFAPAEIVHNDDDFRALVIVKIELWVQHSQKRQCLNHSFDRVLFHTTMDVGHDRENYARDSIWFQIYVSTLPMHVINKLGPNFYLMLLGICEAWSVDDQESLSVFILY